MTTDQKIPGLNPVCALKIKQLVQNVNCFFVYSTNISIYGSSYMRKFYGMHDRAISK